MSAEFTFEAELYEWDGPQSWVFAALPPTSPTSSTRSTGRPAAASARVGSRSVLGGQVWRTSIFPDSKSGTYVLPVKKEIRRKAGVDEGDRVEIDLSVL